MLRARRCARTHPWPGSTWAHLGARFATASAAALMLSAGGTGGSYDEHVLTGCGHSPHLERPAEFHGLVSGFLARAGQRAGS